MPVVIHNSPFGGTSSEAISAAMQGPSWAGGFRFQPARSGQVPSLHTVVAFDSSAGATQRSDVCRNPSAATGTRGALRVVAAFCNGNEPLSVASATAPRPRAASQGSFQRLMVSLSNAIFPIVEYGVKGR